jgi:hypothetical protein
MAIALGNRVEKSGNQSPKIGFKSPQSRYVLHNQQLTKLYYEPHFGLLANFPPNFCFLLIADITL